MLSPIQMKLVDDFLSLTSLLSKKLDILLNEAALFADRASRPSAPIFGLVVTAQPFPMVLSKGDELKEQLQVQLLFGTASQIRSVKPVKALLCTGVGFASASFPTPDEKAIDRAVQPLNMQSYAANFPLVFLSGTRKECSAIRFSTEVQHYDAVEQQGVVAVAVESALSRPLIVMTNQKQWASCEGILLKQLVFRGQLQVPWHRFANHLSSQFFIVTRMKSLFSAEMRSLSPYDFHYLQEKWLDGRGALSIKEFDRFWAWFGSCCHTLKYQKNMNSLWHRGFISGFIGRDQANAALQHQPPGTILIRFSETHPGQVVISHIPHDSPSGFIKHYLVKQTDVSEKVTLPDFIRYQSQWSFVLQYRLNYQTWVPGFFRISKNHALESFYSRGQQSNLETDTGYDPLI